MWTCATDVLYLFSEKFLMATIYSYHWGLPYGWPRTTLFRCFYTWDTLWEILNIPVLMICTRNCCWSWSVALLRFSPSEMVHLASHRFLMLAICFYNLDLSWAWSYKSNIYFRTCRTLQKIFLVSLLMICVYACYVNWTTHWTCADQMFWLTFG